MSEVRYISEKHLFETFCIDMKTAISFMNTKIFQAISWIPVLFDFFVVETLYFVCWLHLISPSTNFCDKEKQNVWLSELHHSFRNSKHRRSSLRDFETALNSRLWYNRLPWNAMQLLFSHRKKLTNEEFVCLLTMVNNSPLGFNRVWISKEFL